MTSDQYDPADEHGDYGTEMEVEEAPTPRRAASAEFVVDSSVGSQAAIRAALDPAHQSLTDALRLSYRVLQVVMIVLVVLFAFSGMKTVNEGETGVMLRWGKIVDKTGDPALAPGIHFSVLPYPAGEFVLFKDRDRTASTGDTFWPGVRPGLSLDDMINQSTTNTMIRPGRDGLVLTRDGDIAHVKAIADFEIERIEDFIGTINEADPDRNAARIVELALRRSTIHAVARMGLGELVDGGDGAVPLAELLKEDTQRFLDAIDSGIAVGDVVTEQSAALSIVRAEKEVRSAMEEATGTVQATLSNRENILIETAGAEWREALRYIDAYERAGDLGDEEAAAIAHAAAREYFRSDKVQGEIHRTVTKAKAYRDIIDSTLGNEVTVFGRVAARLPQEPGCDGRGSLARGILQCAGQGRR